jgi:ketosteroid isomerase-like protein
MQRAFLFFLLFESITLTVSGNPQSAPPQDEQQLRQIEVNTAKGEQQNDVSMMTLFANDWVASSPKKVLSKAEFEQAVKDNFVAHGNGPSPYTITKQDMVVYVFGDTAVVTYIKEYRQTPNTAKFMREDDTDVFKRTPSGWLLQFSKISPAS